MRRGSVNPVGAVPYLLKVPRAEVVAAVPVPLVTWPVDSQGDAVEERMRGEG